LPLTPVAARTLLRLGLSLKTKQIVLTKTKKNIDAKKRFSHSCDKHLVTKRVLAFVLHFWQVFFLQTLDSQRKNDVNVKYLYTTRNLS